MIRAWWNGAMKDNAFIKVMFPVAASIYAIHGPAGHPLLFTGLRNGDVLVFDFIEQKIIKTLKHHRAAIFDIKSAATKNELLVASEDGHVSVWSMESLELVYTIKVSNDTVRSISISPDEKLVAFGCRDNSVKIYELADYSLL